MKQILVKKGEILTEELPEPSLQESTVKIQVLYSCISAGTEASNIASSGQSLIQRVIDKPESIKRAISKVSKMGLKDYWESVQMELNEAKPSGYSLAGRVIETAEDIDDLKAGDLVAAAGGFVASHAEIAVVPKNLVVQIPENVSIKDASTVAIGGIALQGIRRADLDFGANVAVIGTGLLGLLTIQLLKANGMRVAGIDINSDRLDLAKKCGADKTFLANDDRLIEDVTSWSDGFGVDATIITASTNSSEPLSQAFKICRKKGTVVLVGVTGMEIDRKDIYQKELDFHISTSYGPGRYDDTYENQGIDYPYGYVRWTENRNMQAYLRAIADERVNLEQLSQREFMLNEAEEAFGQLTSKGAPLLSFFRYEDHLHEQIIQKRTKNSTKALKVKTAKIRTAVIGTGNYAASKTIPLIIELSQYFSLDVLVNRTPYKAKNIAQTFKVPNIESSVDALLENHEVEAVFITTRHGNHAELALKCLKAGIHVFVEKPLAVNNDQLKKLEDFFDSTDNLPVLCVGFNRRFSPYIQSIKNELENRSHPLMCYYRMNAGYQPKDHWTHEDGGRIIGEGCHILDLFNFITGQSPETISVDAATSSNPGMLGSDNRSLTITYADGSVCTLLYTGQGSNALSKEYLEIHFDQKSITLDDFSELSGYGINLTQSIKKGDKGHKAIIEAFALSVQGQADWPISIDSLFNTTKLALIGSK